MRNIIQSLRNQKLRSELHDKYQGRKKYLRHSEWANGTKLTVLLKLRITLG